MFDQLLMEKEGNDNHDMIPWPESLETPWILFSGENSDHENIQSFYSVSCLAGNSKLYHKSIPQLQGKDIIASSNGWLILQNQKEFNLFSLFNPVTMEVINLTPLKAVEFDKSSVKELQAMLSLPPNVDKCVLFLWSYESAYTFYCRPKQQPACGWVTLMPERQGKTVFVRDVVAVDGVMYGFARSKHFNPTRYERKLFYIKDDLNSLTFCSLDNVDDPVIKTQVRYGGFKGYLLESCHRIYYVIIYIAVTDRNFEFETVRVFELDLDGNIWKEINSLDGRAFFLLPNSCTWCWGNCDEPDSPEGIQRNCIYYIWGTNLPHISSLYSYNVIDQNFTTLWQHLDLECPSYPCVWIVPDDQRLLSLEDLKEKRTKIGDDVSNQSDDFMKSGGLELLDHKVSIEDSILDVLPIDMVELISKCMHLFEYWKFRASCKTLLSVCPAPQWGTNNVLPLFMFSKNNDRSCELIDPCQYNTCSRSLPRLFTDPFSIHFSKNGWLLALVGPHSSRSLKFYNLYTEFWGVLPAFDELLDFMSVGFSTDPTSSDCSTVVMANTPADMLVIYYLQPGDKTWREYYAEFETNVFSGTLFSPPIFYEGAFYFVDVYGCLGEFEIVKDREPTWFVYNSRLTIVDEFADSEIGYNLHLVECAGEICVVYADKMGKQVQVLQFDWLNVCWVKMVNLGYHSLFISRGSTLSFFTGDTKIRNRIYFPKLRGKSVMFYSLDTKMFHFLGSEDDDSVQDFYGTTEPLKCCWI